jgi:hypothetical protein
MFSGFRITALAAGTARLSTQQPSSSEGELK